MVEPSPILDDASRQRRYLDAGDRARQREVAEREARKARKAERRVCTLVTEATAARTGRSAAPRGPDRLDGLELLDGAGVQLRDYGSTVATPPVASGRRSRSTSRGSASSARRGKEVDGDSGEMLPVLFLPSDRPQQLSSSAQIRLETMRSWLVAVLLLLPYVLLAGCLLLDLSTALREAQNDLPPPSPCDGAFVKGWADTEGERQGTCITSPTVSTSSDGTRLVQMSWYGALSSLSPSDYVVLRRKPVLSLPSRGRASDGGEALSEPTRDQIVSEEVRITAKVDIVASLARDGAGFDVALSNATAPTLLCRVLLRGNFPRHDSSTSGWLSRFFEDLRDYFRGVTGGGSVRSVAYSCGGGPVASMRLTELESTAKNIEQLRMRIAYSVRVVPANVIGGSSGAPGAGEEDDGGAQEAAASAMQSVLEDVVGLGDYELLTQRPNFIALSMAARLSLLTALVVVAVFWFRHLRGSWGGAARGASAGGEEAAPLLGERAPASGAAGKAPGADGMSVFALARPERFLLSIALVGAFLWLDPSNLDPRRAVPALSLLWGPPQADAAPSAPASTGELHVHPLRPPAQLAGAVVSRVLTSTGAQILLFAGLSLLDGMRYARGTLVRSGGYRESYRMKLPPHDPLGSRGAFWDFYLPKLMLLASGVVLALFYAMLQTAAAASMLRRVFDSDRHFANEAEDDTSQAYAVWSRAAAGVRMVQLYVLVGLWGWALYSAFSRTQAALRRRSYLAGRAQHMGFRMIELWAVLLAAYCLLRFLSAVLLFGGVLREISPAGVALDARRPAWSLRGALVEWFWAICNVLVPPSSVGVGPAAHMKAVGEGSLPGKQVFVVGSLLTLLWMHLLPPQDLALQSGASAASAADGTDAAEDADAAMPNPRRRAKAAKVYRGGFAVLERQLGGVCSDEAERCRAPYPRGAHVLCVETCAWLCEVAWQTYYQLPSSGVDTSLPRSASPRLRMLATTDVTLAAASGYGIALSHLGLELRMAIECPTLDLSGFLARGRGRWVLSFRGSVSGTNLLTDLRMSRSPLRDFMPLRASHAHPHRRGGLAASRVDRALVHTGFITAYMAIRSQVLQALEVVAAEGPDLPLYTCGHSLGGALACLAAVDASFKEMPSGKPVLYTFGAPRVGDATFGKLLESVVPWYFRVETDGDPITAQPPRPFFSHAGVEILLEVRSGDILIAPSPIDRLLRNRVDRARELHSLAAYLDGLEAAMSNDEFESMVRFGLMRGSIKQHSAMPQWMRHRGVDLEV